MTPPRTIRDLWADYTSDPSIVHRNRLVEHYTYLADATARRLAAHFNGALEHDDLLNYGIIGLIDAVSKYDPQRGHRFEAYAAGRIQGEMLDGLRTDDWVPKRVRARARQLRVAEERLVASGKAISYDNLAGELGTTSAMARLAVGHAHAVDKVSINHWNGEDLTESLAASTFDPVNEYEVTAIAESMAAAITGLPDRERVVLALIYREDRTLEEVGELLHVSRTRASQLQTTALAYLHRLLAGQDLVPAP